MLPRPRSVLDHPALFGRRPVAPTGMMAIGADEPAKPDVDYGFEFPSREEEAELYAQMDAEHPTHPLTQYADRPRWKWVFQEGMRAFAERVQRLDREEKFLEAFLLMLHQEHSAGQLLEEKRPGIEQRLRRRAEQVAEAKSTIGQMAQINKHHYMDMLAMHHVLDRDITAASDNEVRAILAARDPAQGTLPGYVSLDGRGFR